MVFVIAATNRKDMIDEATLRAGRIQKHLYVPQPTETERVEILRAITKRMKIDESVRFEEIARKTKGFSGADLKFLVKEATVSAVMENRAQVLQEDLNKATDDLLFTKRKNKLEERVH
jgi:ATP-dependent 26S proteasome regulatory subunit